MPVPKLASLPTQVKVHVQEVEYGFCTVAANFLPQKKTAIRESKEILDWKMNKSNTHAATSNNFKI